MPGRRPSVYATALDLRAILQKPDTFWATFNKMLCKTTDAQYSKLKKQGK